MSTKATSPESQGAPEPIVQTVVLPAELNQRAEQFAQSHRVSMNQVIAAALYNYFETHKERSNERSTLIFSR